MIRVSAFWPDGRVSRDSRGDTQTYMGPLVAYHVERLDMVGQPSELFLPPNYTVVCIQEDGVPLPEFEHPEDAHYITGSTTFRWPSQHIEQESLKVSIPVPENRGPEHTMYGHQALAIVLYDRYLKNGSSLHGR